jgi:glycine/D-amino acid oxidase-like deaminating enzyme/nitrite reductase/ring-hydroxylating ferredoxin subunit
MKRDGACISLWQDTVAERNLQSNEFQNPQFDVLIVGGGITGITTALLLQKKGKRCVVAESHNICFGTTGGTTAHLNTFFDTTYDQIISDFGEHNAQLVGRATRSSLDLFKQHVQEYSIDCGYEQKNGYVYAQTNEQLEQLQKMFEATQRAGVAVSYTESIPVPVEFRKAIMYPGQAQLHPTRYVQALAEAFVAAGGVLLENCHVENFEEASGVLSTATSKGTIHSNYLIYATHIPPGVNLLHFRCAPYRSYALAAQLKNDSYPDALAYDMYDPYHYVRTQTIDGQQYLIVGGEDHKTAHVKNTNACFNHLESYTRKYYEVEEIAYKWSSQYFEPSDGLAYIGHLPGNPDNVFVATGYSGNGITYSHIAAITLTDLITTGESEFADLFAPGRVKPVAGFTSFVKENVDVVKEFFKKRFSPKELPELADLAHDEGRLVKYEGETIALYKDAEGNLHAVDPICPHAKCAVDWNSAEKSWDCPCHGSRFSFNGEVLTGPARRGLDVVEISEMAKGTDE